MRTLYFDIDGTVLCLYSSDPKRALAQGAFGRAIREAGFEKLVCVGNYSGVALDMVPLVENFDALGSILDVCAGVFDDEAWFRARTHLIADPEQRAAEVNLGEDWWYIDDLAEKYFAEVGRDEVYLKNHSGRIFVPSPDGDGEDVLAWIRAIGAGLDP